jgi:ABC-type Fe3+/spermidine/putrescine transport system ATPase subunit
MSESNSSTLRVRNLQIGYQAPLHEPFTFTVEPGAVLGVVGPSGCGKSTLLATIAGLTPALSGSVEIAGRDVTHLPVHDRRVGLVFQESLLFPHLSIRDNVAYGPRRRGVSRAEARSEADRLLAWVGLEGFGDRDVGQLSGGQAQRVSLARALAAEPAVLCLDEPFSALDAPLRARLAQDVLAIIARANIPAIHVTHDCDEAATMAQGNPGGSILSM